MLIPKRSTIFKIALPSSTSPFIPKIFFIPLDRLLIETDSPYLAPEPHRGKKSEPSFVIYTAKKLAEIKNVPNTDLIKKTTLNFENLFN